MATENEADPDKAKVEVVIVPASKDTPPQLGPAAIITVRDGETSEETLARLQALIS